jgi:hypothetical protein
MPIALKILIAVSIILGTSWLSGKRPELAGFLTALPLVSILALAFSYTDHGSLTLSAKYARSIIIAVPVSWLFWRCCISFKQRLAQVKTVVKLTHKFSL